MNLKIALWTCMMSSIDVVSLSFCSNLGYALISRVLAEKFANNDYEGWVQTNILIPLGMRNSGFNLKRYEYCYVVSRAFPSNR